MDGLKKRLGKLWPVRLAAAYGSSQAGNYAAGLAFNGFMTMFPLLAGLLAVFGFALSWDPSLQEKAQSALFTFLPNGSPSQDVLSGLRHNAGTLGLISLAGLVWTGTGFFASMEFALDSVYRVPQRDFLRQRLMGLAMLGVFIVAILVAVFANSAAALVSFVPLIGPLVGVAVMVALFAVIYKVVPNRPQRLRDVLPGAVLAGVMVEALTLLFPLYLRLVKGFSSYGSTFALFLLLATWLYFLSQAILLGAVLNQLLLGKVPEPETGAASAPGDDREAGGGEVEPSRGRDLKSKAGDRHGAQHVAMSEGEHSGSA